MRLSHLELNSLLQVLVRLLDQLFSPQHSVPHHVLGATAAGGDGKKKPINAGFNSLESNVIFFYSRNLSREVAEVDFGCLFIRGFIFWIDVFCLIKLLYYSLIASVVLKTGVSSRLCCLHPQYNQDILVTKI